MGAKTGIEWTDATWNCWQGCHKVSPGCKNCYMFADKQRYGQDPDVVVRSADATFMAPLRWANNEAKFGHIKRIFVDSWSDFFVAEADEWREEAWTVIRATPCFDYQICTKRPERIAAHLPADWGKGYPNVWLMTTAENQPMADLRIPILLSIPAVVHGVSIEPMLRYVSLEELPSASGIGRYLDALSNGGVDAGALIPNKLDWVICGGESGPGARPMHPDWARSLRDQCAAAGVPFFFKQWGEWAEVDGGPPNRVFDVDKQHAPIDRTNCVISHDGRVPSTERELQDDVKYRWMTRIGKKAAGSLLDGVEHKAFPEVQPCQ